MRDIARAPRDNRGGMVPTFPWQAEALSAAARGEKAEDSMNLVERVKAILLTPNTEWPVIEREPGDAAYLFTNYVAILAAIPAVCGLVGGIAFGGSIVLGIVNAIKSFQ